MNQQENYCFVIQPISDEKYDKRFVDIYEPAILNANITAYRVDQDSTVRDIIQSIEKKIDAATICFADISIDNPNVWYELGYATAKGKDIVIVCDENRKGRYPFDISHRNIIQYKSESSSDFMELSKKITERINSYLRNQERNQKIIEAPLKSCDGLQHSESLLLGIIAGEQITDTTCVSVYTLQETMFKYGYNKIAIGIGLRSLKHKKLIDILIDTDWNGNEYEGCKLTQQGNEFILLKRDLFELDPTINLAKNSDASSESDSTNFELPF